MTHHQIVKPVSLRRKRTQSGLEAIEFGLWALLVAPAFVWMFISGIGFVRLNKASDVTRSAAMMYMKGSNMMTPGSQAILQRVASGLDLQAVTGGTTLVNNAGSGLIVLTKIQYLGACSCTNANNYVIMQRIYIGNRSLQIGGSTVESFSGPVSVALWSSVTGDVANYTSDTAARSGAGVQALWSNSLSNGQVIYVVETFVRTPSFGSGEFDSRGIYNRVFM